MVVQGGFLLQLIDAETQQPLNEYRGPSGAVYYAEATIGRDYFLRFQVLRQDELEQADKTTSGEKEREMMYFRPSVDGKDLGFYTNLSATDGARDVGLWTYVNGIGTNRALKFETAAVNSKPDSTLEDSVMIAAPSTVSEEEASASSDSQAKSGPPRLHMGNVQVQISKAVFTGYQKRVYSSIPSLAQEETVVVEAAVSISASSSLHEEEETGDATGACNGTNAGGEKAADDTKVEVEDALRMMDPVPVLRSREGDARFEQEFTEECPTYKPGELLETITIHYGSTAALVQAGVLVPAGSVPEYVGVSQVPALEKAADTPVVPSPLLDASSSTQPTGAKRLHSSVVSGAIQSNEDAVNPTFKKPCRESDESEPDPSSAAVVSGQP